MLFINTLGIDWDDLLFGSEDGIFIFEVILRTVIMFLVIVTGLRILGKRGVKQLSVFELVVIIGLGSAAGDPMFYKDVGIVFSVTVFAIIILFYSLLTFLIGKSKKIEALFEGKSSCLIEKGVFSIENFKKENLGNDEFFSELRLKGVSHLGQIETAIEEVSGDISVFFYEDENIKYGLPIMLNSLEHPFTVIPEDGHYSCTFCGYTAYKSSGDEVGCKICSKKYWVASSNRRRVT